MVFRNLIKILDTVSINCRKIVRFGHPCWETTLEFEKRF